MVEIDGVRYILEILDTAGTEEYQELRDLYMRNADAFICVFSLTAVSTFNDLPNIIQQIERIRETNYDEIPMVIVGNKADLKNQRQVQTKQGQLLGKHINKTYVETSAKYGMFF